MAVRVNSFLVLEESLRSHVMNSWQREVAPAMRGIVFRLADKDINGALELVEQLGMEGVAERSATMAETIGMQAILFGASSFVKPNRSVFADLASPPLLLDSAINQFKMMLSVTGTENVKVAARRVIAAVETQDKERSQAIKAGPGELAREMGQKVGGTSAREILTATSLYNSRLASWGFAVQAESVGATSYKVFEQVGTLNICPVCRAMHGKVFNVAPARAKLEGWLSVDDPQSLKNVATWPRQDQASVEALGKMSPEDLQGAGWDTPPYHPLCRGILRRTNQAADSSGPLSMGSVGALILPPVRPSLRPKPVSDVPVTGSALIAELEAELGDDLSRLEIGLSRRPSRDVGR